MADRQSLNYVRLERIEVEGRLHEESTTRHVKYDHLAPIHELPPALERAAFKRQPKEGNLSLDFAVLEAEADRPACCLSLSRRTVEIRHSRLRFGGWVRRATCLAAILVAMGCRLCVEVGVGTKAFVIGKKEGGGAQIGCCCMVRGPTQRPRPPRLACASAWEVKALQCTMKRGKQTDE